MHGECVEGAWEVHGKCMGCAWAVHWAAEGVSRSGGHGRLHRLGLQIVGPRRMFAHGPKGGRGEGGFVGCIRGGSWEGKGWCLGAALPLHTCETLCERPRGMSFICAVIGVHVGQGSPHAE